MVTKAPAGELTPPTCAATAASPSGRGLGTCTLIWYRPEADRPANVTLAGTLLNVITGMAARVTGVETIWPFVTAGVVAPKPFPYSTMVSPGWAGVVTFAISVGGPMIEPFACVAAMYLSLLIRKNEGATAWAATLTVLLVSPLLVTTICTCPLLDMSTGVRMLICTGLM